jgi:hypothetical protein
MSRLSATAIRDENTSEAIMNAVIIYDLFDFAVAANALLSRAAHRADETTRWSVMPWRVDILKLPPAAEVALAEALGADLILLPIRLVQSIPAWVVDWLEKWARCRRVQDAAVAVWAGGTADTLSAPASPELSRFAEHHGLSLIFDNNALVEDRSSVFVSKGNKREKSLTPPLRRILEKPVHGSYQHWGINE